MLQQSSQKRCLEAGQPLPVYSHKRTISQASSHFALVNKDLAALALRNDPLNRGVTRDIMMRSLCRVSHQSSLS